MPMLHGWVNNGMVHSCNNIFACLGEYIVYVARWDK